MITEECLIQTVWSALQNNYPKHDFFADSDELMSFISVYNAFKKILDVPFHKRKREEIRETLQKLKLSEKSIDQVLNLTCHKDNAFAVEPYILNTRARQPHISSTEWRVNVTVSSSFIKRVMVPYVELKLTLNDGQILYLELNLKQLHTLRYTVAKLLKEMQRLEAKSALQHYN